MERYQPSLEWVDNDAFAHVTEDPEGDYVLHSDAAALIAELERERDDARAKLDALTSSIRSACMGSGCLNAYELRLRIEMMRGDLTRVVAEVKAWRTFANAAEDSSWYEAWKDHGEGVSAAESATDADPVLRAMVEKGGGEG